MAAASAASGLNEDALRALYGARAPGGALPSLFLRLPAREDGTVLRAQCTLIKLRFGGFMIAAPDTEEVAHLLQDQEVELEGGVEATAIHLAEVEMETTRGRLLGTAAILLVDLCWDLANLFIRAHSLRSSQAFELLRFSHEGRHADLVEVHYSELQRLGSVKPWTKTLLATTQ